MDEKKKTNYIREVGPYGIYLSRISGRFHIVNTTFDASIEDSYSSLDGAVRAAKKLIKEDFEPIEVIYKGHKFHREVVQLLTVHDYRNDESIFDKMKVWTRDPAKPDSLYGDWIGLRFLYEATPQNVKTMDYIHMLEGQIGTLREMIVEAKKGLTDKLTMGRFMELTTKKESNS